MGSATGVTKVDVRVGDAACPPESLKMPLALGLQIGGETRMIFAKGAAQASIEVTVTWRKDRQPDADSAYGGVRQ